MTKGQTNAQPDGGTTYTAGTGIIIDSGKIIQDGIVDLTGTTASDSTGLSLSYSEGGTKYNGNYVSRSNSVILFKTGDGLSWDTSTSPPTLEASGGGINFSTSFVTGAKVCFVRFTISSSYSTSATYTGCTDAVMIPGKSQTVCINMASQNMSSHANFTATISTSGAITTSIQQAISVGPSNTYTFSPTISSAVIGCLY